MRHYILKRYFLDAAWILKESVFLVFLKGLPSVYPSVCMWKKVNNGGLGKPTRSFLRDVQTVEWIIYEIKKSVFV